MPRTSLIRGAPALVVLACLGLAGCGRRGPLEPAPGAGAPTQRAAPPAPEASVGAEASDINAPPRAQNVTPPNQPFFLDPLL